MAEDRSGDFFEFHDISNALFFFSIISTTTMFDLKKFQEIWKAARSIGYRRNTSTNFHCSYLDAFLIKDLIEEGDLELFVSMMYSHALFVQAVFGMVNYQDTELSLTEEVENTFPRVNGILSTANKHVCPALLPTLLLYLGEEDVIKDGSLTYSLRNAVKERNTWIEKGHIFHEGISQVISRIELLLNIYLSKGTFQIDLIERRITHGHEYIKKCIYEKNDAGRILNY